MPCAWTIISIFIFASGGWYVNCTACIDKANYYSIAAARFCTDNTITGNPVVLDGYFANSLDGIINCVCVANIDPEPTYDVILTYYNAFDISPIQNTSSCGSSVFFTQPLTQERVESCKIDGSMSYKKADSNIEIILAKEAPDGDTSYCFKLEIKDTKFTLKLKCNPSGEIKTSTFDHDTTTFTSHEDPYVSTEATIMSTVGKTERVFSATTGRLTDGATNSHHYDNVTDVSLTDVTEGSYVETDRFKLIYVVIGCGTAAGLSILIIVICVIICSRRGGKPSNEPDENIDINDDNEEDGLVYNSLYVSADDDAIQRDSTTQKASDTWNEVAYTAEGNYNEIYLDKKLNNENKRCNDLEKKYYGGLTNDDGDYSDVNLDVKRESSSSSHLKDDSSVKLSVNNKESFEMATVIAGNSSPVEHGISPSGSGCENVVVQKQSKANRSSNVYAVVDKTSKLNT